MNNLGQRLLILWYRLQGMTRTQAEWRAQRRGERPPEGASAARDVARRVADRRFKCACGQLLVAGDRVCVACGRRQLPWRLQQGMRLLGLVVPQFAPGTSLVIALCVLGFAVQMRVGGLSLFGGHAFIDLIEVGASHSALTLPFQPWRAVTYAFMHGNLLHLLFNLMALVQVGPLVEEEFGRGRFLFAWVAGSAAGVLLPPLIGVERGVPVVGASAGVFTLIGMALLHGHRLRTSQGRMIRDVMIRWAIYTTVFGLMMRGMGMAHGAHFAGLAAGLGLAWLLPPAGQHPTRRRLGPLLGLLGIGALSAGLVALVLWRAQGAPPPSTLDRRLQVPWSLERAERDGLDAALDATGRALLAQSRLIGDGDGPEGAELVRRVEAYTASGPPGAVAVLVEELADNGPDALRDRLHRLRVGEMRKLHRGR